MGRPPRITNNHLLAAARKAFIKSGRTGSTKEIARDAGISEAALFKRYPTKAALFLAAMQPPAVDAKSMLAVAVAEESTAEGLIQIGLAALSYFRTALPVILPLITHPSIGLDELLRHMGKGPSQEIAKTITRYIAQQRAAGRMRSSDPQAAASTLMAAMHSVALFEIMGLHGGKLPDRGVRAIIHSLWEGLAPIDAKPASRKPR